MICITNFNWLSDKQYIKITKKQKTNPFKQLKNLKKYEGKFKVNSFFKENINDIKAYFFEIYDIGVYNNDIKTYFFKI